MDRAELMQRKDFIFTEALATEAFPNFKLQPWITKMLSKNKVEYNSALEELNAAWKYMYPSNNVNYFPQFARSQVFMAMNDYESYIKLDDEPMHMRVFLAFHNQIVIHENETKKGEKKRNKVEQRELKLKREKEQRDHLREIINKESVRVRKTKKQDVNIAKPKKVQNIIFTIEFANNELPYIDLSTWVVQVHSNDKSIRDSANDSLNEAFCLRFSESDYKIRNVQALNRIESGLDAYESIVPQAERSLQMTTFRKIINSYRARKRDISKRLGRTPVSQELVSTTQITTMNDN